MSDKKPEPYKLKPKDSSTLIIVRDGKEVLMGQRSTKHVFMANKYVFPGGRVDRADGMVPRPIDLETDVAEQLERGTTAHRARALAMAAIRETWEEAGLVLGTSHDEPVKTRSPGWKEFYGKGVVPALDKLEYIARAVTPPGRPRRFDSRFFMVDAHHLDGQVMGNGELEDLQWVPIRDAHDLDLPNITRLVIDLIDKRVKDRAHRKPGAGIPFVRTINRRHIISDH
ncbi:MAG: NUDIX hydrolase [Alphaproteobacteria bacterium]